ncbi:tetratricopeptide repeat protein [Pseudoduganella sp. HUAS MS19]
MRALLAAMANKLSIFEMTITPATFFAATLLCASPFTFAADSDFAFTDKENIYISAMLEFEQIAELRTPAKQFMVAREHEHGGDLGRDDKRSQKLYILAANGGHIAAQKHLVAAYRKKSSGSALSAKQVAAWEANIKRHEGAASPALMPEPGRTDRVTEFRLSLSLSDPSQQQQAFALLEKSAESGYMQAQLSLAYKYRRGLDGVQRNAARSKQWYLKAAEQLWTMADNGNPIAARVLADLSLHSKEIPYDPELAGVLLKVLLERIPGNERDAEELHKIQRELPPERLARLNATAAQWRPGMALPRDLRQAICTSSDFVQSGFDKQKAQAEFADFQTRLRKAIDDVSDVEPRRVGETAALTAVGAAFAGTIATGAKGDALLEELIQPSPRRVVSPLGSMFDKIMGKACPVGFGGSFTDDGNTVELWYVDLDPADRGSLQAFPQAALPAHGSLVRGKFPALAFSRNESGKLQLYGMSQEMAMIMQFWWGVQLM